MNDILSNDDLIQLTKVKQQAHNRIERIGSVLKAAGIYYWLCDDGSIGTTWTHVHQANNKQAINAPTLPNFKQVS